MTWGAGLHATATGHVDASADWQYIGRLSQRFVPALLAAADIGPGDRVLDVATGTGVAAQLALSLVGDSGLVVGADISLAMLDAARARLSSGQFLPVVSDGEALVFPDARFDAVLCKQTLHLSFSLADPARLEQLLGAAGFSDVRVTRETREGTVASFEYWAPIEAGTGQMPQAYLALPAPIRRAVREEVQARLSPFGSNGRLTMSVDMLIGTGRA